VPPFGATGRSRRACRRPGRAGTLRRAEVPIQRDRATRPVLLACAAACVAACVAAGLACAERDAIPSAPGAPLAVGTWGGENAGVIVDDTVAHVHIGCTFGNFAAPLRPGPAGGVSATGSWVLRAYPVVVGPALPARLTGTVAGDALTFRVTVDDTVSHTTVELGPVTVTRGREPRMGPCPICRVPRALPAAPRAPRSSDKRLVRNL
jgi:hypothetical protein